MSIQFITEFSVEVITLKKKEAAEKSPQSTNQEQRKDKIIFRISNNRAKENKKFPSPWFSPKLSQLFNKFRWDFLARKLPTNHFEESAERKDEKCSEQKNIVNNFPFHLIRITAKAITVHVEVNSSHKILSIRFERGNLKVWRRKCCRLKRDA